MESAIPKPLISVLLPARNAENTLEACLQSLVAQSEKRWECVLVNDGSVDRTGSIAHGFAAHDPRFGVLECEHRGIVPSLNEGLERCRGDFIARMDADDRMHPERLAAQHAALKANPQWVAAGCHVSLFPRESLKEGQLAYETWLNEMQTAEQLRADAFVECPIAHPTFFGRREAFLEFGYEDNGWPEDYDLLLRWLGAGHSFGVVPRELLAWRQSEESLSRTGDVYRQENFTRCKAFYLYEHFLKGRPRYVLWGYGGTGRALCKALAARGSEPSHIVELHPRRLGKVIHGAPVVRPEALAALREANGRLQVIASVAGAKPRAEIRAALDAMGFTQGLDYVCAA